MEHSSSDEYYIVDVGGLSLLAKVRFAPIIMLIRVGTFEGSLGHPVRIQPRSYSLLSYASLCAMVQVAHNLLCTVTYHTTKCLDLVCQAMITRFISLIRRLEAVACNSFACILGDRRRHTGKL